MSEEESLLDELWATPVGRRWVLQAGLASAVAVGLGSRVAGAALAEAPQQARREPEVTELQLALGQQAAAGRLTLVADGRRWALVRHTAASRERLRQQGGIWAHVDLSVLTHHVAGVELPADRATVLTVRGRRAARDVVVAQHLHVPAWATLRLARMARRLLGSVESLRGSPERLAGLGLDPSDIRSPRHLVQLSSYADAFSTAAAIVGFHPSVATVNTTAAGITGPLLQSTPAVVALGNVLQSTRHPFGLTPTALDADGKTPSRIEVGGQPMTFQTFRFNTADPNLQPALEAAVKAGVQVVRNSSDLGAVIDQPLDQSPDAATRTWVQSQGLVPRATPYPAAGQVGGGLDINVLNPGVNFGTQVVATGTYSNGQVPLTVYNNWVRWAWIYVQYLGAGNENLSANANPTWPDTSYSQSLGLLPQINTILGVPLWGTNELSVTLDFPPGSHTARLLICGLGADVVAGEWRRYFPADAYPDKIAPTNEVLVAALVTGVITIGLTAFSLAGNLNAATAFVEIQTPVSELAKAGAAILDAILLLGLPVAEATAVAVSSGSANVQANSPNIWNLLLPLAAGIPKILFSPDKAPAWGEVGAAIAGEEAAEKVVEAIPFIGEVLEVLSLLGDVATLAEVAAEALVAPWAIENEVNLTYQATVTVSHDPNDSSTWPTTARAWRLQAAIDGAAVLNPITGTVNEGGIIRSDDLKLQVTAPFGGRAIQWSFTLTDATGYQVGTGVSAQLTNNDPNDVAAAVAITFRQIAVPITATTTFTRSDTTGYRAATGGYTWSDQITSSGTLADSGLQQVAGAAISTLAGVAGVVWEEGDRFHLRGVPTAENGSTIQLGPATGDGWDRQPFLLLDPFVDRDSAGNHVLLEPDEATLAYHVRRVTLDPVTAAPTWDPAVSYGTFPLPISAAALHATGRVFTVNTDTGRLGRLTPAATLLPPPAAYSAGSGTQVGLLSSPVAIAVTHAGVVLVLEAAAHQVAAFDLNGNPAPYFPGQGVFTLPLPGTSTYLDLAVDGSDQLYVLYYASDGATPSDYRVDVYSPAGTLVNSNSPGVNVPHLAVDHWRSIFAANLDALADAGSGQAHVDPALGVAEPSVSRFDPEKSAGAARRRVLRRPR